MSGGWGNDCLGLVDIGTSVYLGVGTVGCVGWRGVGGW